MLTLYTGSTVYILEGYFWQVLRTFLVNCLTQATADSLATIALPPLGTGNLHSPPIEVANIILEEVKKFCTKNPTTSLKDIYIVLYRGDEDKRRVRVIF